MSADLTKQIRERAYQLWTIRPDRSDLDNWLAAEREIRQRQPVTGQETAAQDGTAGRKTRAARRKAH